MPNYLLAYHGGSTPEGAEAEASVMEAWNNWMADVGHALIDGGAPVGVAKLLTADGRVGDVDAQTKVTGYSILEADDIEAAIALANGCPVLADGGSVEISELVEVEMDEEDEDEDAEDEDSDDDDDDDK